MDKNQVVGIVLIFALLMVWQQFFAPSPEALEADQRRQDSIANIEQQLADKANAVALNAPDTNATTATAALSDSILLLQRSGVYGAFAAATIGEEKIETLENDLMTVSVSTKGGNIDKVVLKKHFKVLEDSAGVQTKVPLELLEDKKNKFESRDLTYFLSN